MILTVLNLYIKLKQRGDFWKLNLSTGILNNSTQQGIQKGIKKYLLKSSVSFQELSMY